MIEQEEESYELFRRAIVDRENDAWALIYSRYRPLLAAWASRSGARALAGEWADDTCRAEGRFITINRTQNTTTAAGRTVGYWTNHAARSSVTPSR